MKYLKKLFNNYHLLIFLFLFIQLGYIGYFDGFISQLGILQSFNGNIYNNILAAVYICFVGPILEEIIFRRWVWRDVSKIFKSKIIVGIIVAILFASCHYFSGGLSIIIKLLPISLGLSYLRNKTKGITHGVFLHMLYNCSIMIWGFISWLSLM